MIKIIYEDSMGSQLLTFFKLSFLIYTIKCPEKNINVILYHIVFFGEVVWRKLFLEKLFFGEVALHLIIFGVSTLLTILLLQKD